MYFGLIPIQFFARIPKGMGVGEVVVVGSLSFDVQRWGGGGGVLANSDPSGQTEKGRREGDEKLGHFSWTS